MDNESKKMSILYIEQVSDFLGGGQVSLYQLIKNLNRKKYHPVLITKDYGSFSKKLSSLGLPIYYLNFTTLKGLGFLKIPNYLLKIKNIIKAEDIKIIHVSPPRLIFLAGIIAKILKIPMIWHVRITETTWLLDRINYFLVDKIIVNSIATSKRFYFSKTEDKVEVVYNGLDFSSFNITKSKENILSELKINKKKIIIGNVSRFSADKDQLTLIKAFEMLCLKYSHLHLVLVGNDDPHDKKYKDSLCKYISKLTISIRITIVNYKESIENYINMFDIFVLPSREESFGRVLIEAFYLSKPVVATSAGGIPEIVEKNKSGILVPVADFVKMAEAIEYLLENKEIARMMGDRGKKIVEEKFLIKKHIVSIENIYEKILWA